MVGRFSVERNATDVRGTLAQVIEELNFASEYGY
jgi:hypothetical protein